ncbi:hypothetical protein ACTQ53_11120 [Prevotella sp. Sow4_E9_plate]|uniref:hypothetical protein n=1 Tax=Prevotella sp. Sow4_E9_plate TaxID=3438802 RepID=UPI003F97A082
MKGIAALAPTLLLTLILTSCMSDGYTDTAAGKSDTYINLNVSTPTAQARAKAPANPAGTSGTPGQDETNPSPDTEEKITSIRVWAFKSDSEKATATPIGFKSETNLSKQGSHNVSMMITRKNAKTLGKIDLYILLNAESVGVLDGKDCIKMTREKLEALVIKNNFGIDNGTAQTTVVPDAGLPISRVIKELDVTNNIKDNAAEAAANPVSVPLVRAVSKLHFFFTRKNVKDTEGVEVTKIEVNENVIPTQSSVFPTATTYANKETDGLTGDLTSLKYLNEKMTFGGVATGDIKPVTDPASYIRKPDQTAEDYITQLRGLKTECHLSYLRETGKELTGTIYFKLRKNGAEKHKTFRISKAYRNHEMVVYGYFLGDEESTLTLKYYVADWTDKGTTNIEFN